MKKETIIIKTAHIVEIGSATTLTMGMGTAGNEGQRRPVYIQTK